MKFKKVVSLIGKNKLTQEGWTQIQAVSEEFISLPAESKELEIELQTTDCLLLQFSPKITAHVIDSTPKLKYIGALSTGYGHIDIVKAKQQGITVTNVPGYATNAVAELVIAVILENIRKITQAKQQASTGNFEESPFETTSEIRGKKFGIIGAGQIGSRVAELALVFGASVVYWSKNRKPDLEKKGVQYTELNELLEICDFISLNLALNPDTTDFLSQEKIENIKSGAILINLAPNELINLDALEKRLANKEMTYIFDHTDELPKEIQDRLRTYEMCTLLPPMGCTTKECAKNREAIFLENIENYLKGKPTNQVGL